VNRIWSYADRVFTAAATESDRARAILLQLHCALIIASINSLSMVIPTEVLLGSLRCGLIKLPTALTLARQTPNQNAKVSLLSKLAGEMPPEAQASALGEALATARDMDQASGRSSALSVIAQQQPAEEP
jgi:hypothetical protein